MPIYISTAIQFTARQAHPKAMVSGAFYNHRISFGSGIQQIVTKIYMNKRSIYQNTAFVYLSIVPLLEGKRCSQLNEDNPFRLFTVSDIIKNYPYQIKNFHWRISPHGDG